MIEQLTDKYDPQQFTSIHEVLDYIRKNHSDRPAYSCFGRTLTYSQVDHYSTVFASFLTSHKNLNPGDRIAVQLPNLLQFPIVVFGAIKAGMVVVNTNPLYTAREMRHQFSDSGVKAIVVLENFCAKLEQIIDETEIELVITTQLGDLQSLARRLITNIVVKYGRRMVPAYKLDTRDLNTILNRSGEIGEHAMPVPSGDDIAMILYTGGTTGYAKGVMLSHQNLIANMMQMRSRCEGVIMDEKEIIVAPLPLYHSYAFLFHCLMMPFAGNQNILIPNPRDLDTVLGAFDRFRVTGFVGINTLYAALLNHVNFTRADYSELHFCGAGGMPLSKDIAQQWQQLTGSTVFEGYGLTECSPVVTLNVPGRHKIGTVGLPMADTEVRVVDDSGVALGIQQKGELQIRGPQVMLGYWGRAEETAAVLSEDGWFSTGDIAEIDEDGYISIVDRKKDMILVSGFNVIPAEIEDWVNTHPQVLESAAIGVPDKKTGEAVVLYVVAKDEVLTAQDLIQFCKKALTGYKLPEVVIFLDDLPKSNIGKVLRRELKEQFLQSVS